jgi:hypothetical protein
LATRLFQIIEDAPDPAVPVGAVLALRGQDIILEVVVFDLANNLADRRGNGLTRRFGPIPIRRSATLDNRTKAPKPVGAQSRRVSSEPHDRKRPSVDIWLLYPDVRVGGPFRKCCWLVARRSHVDLGAWMVGSGPAGDESIELVTVQPRCVER